MTAPGGGAGQVISRTTPWLGFAALLASPLEGQLATRPANQFSANVRTMAPLREKRRHQSL